MSETTVGKISEIKMGLKEKWNLKTPNEQKAVIIAGVGACAIAVTAVCAGVANAKLGKEPVETKAEEIAEEVKAATDAAESAVL